jgi:glutathione S-transferase
LARIARDERQRDSFMQQHYKHYCFGESGNAYKVALYLETNGLSWEPVFVDFFNGETRSEAYRRDINPMGEVPVLVSGEKKLTQSGAILTHLADMHKKYSGKSADECNEILRWMLFDNHNLTSSLATLRFLVHFKKSGETPVTEWLRGRALSALDVLDQQLAVHPFVVGPRLTIADFSLCGYLFYGEEIPLDISQFAHIKPLLDRLRDLPRWKHPYDLMPRAVSAG